MTPKSLSFLVAGLFCLLCFPSGKRSAEPLMGPVPGTDTLHLARQVLADNLPPGRRAVNRVARYAEAREARPCLSAISPYEAIIREQAARNGLDWRLVSAIIRHESNFRPDVVSPAGAIGLMQVRPGSVPADSLADPGTNIRTGTAYLSKLMTLFQPHAANGTECIKFMLAGYNTGDSRLMGLIQAARTQGTDPSYWSGIVPVLRKAQGSGGRETVAFVENVMDTWREYCLFYRP